jgi:hypothetical protein
MAASKRFICMETVVILTQIVLSTEFAIAANRMGRQWLLST